MRILPVLDIMAGQVVRGMGGRRHEYRPIVSRLTTSCAPLEVARAFRERLGFDELYVADLDALGGAAPALATFASLRRDGFTLWVDAGLRDAESAIPLLESGVNVVVAGLESIAGPDVLRELCLRHTSERIVFSLDLKAGKPLRGCPKRGLTPCTSPGFLSSLEKMHPAGQGVRPLFGQPLTPLPGGEGQGVRAWNEADAFGIATTAIAAGVRRILVLDLARVGVGDGPGTEALCQRLSANHPDVELSAGGGVRSADDLRALHEAGVTTTLLASCLHDGRFEPGWLKMCHPARND